MSPFDLAFEYAMGNECDPRNPDAVTKLAGDSGGRTRYGIASLKHPEIDLDKLTREGAKQFYTDEVWFPMNLQEVALATDAVVAAKVFDMATNAGNLEAAKLFQRAVLDTRMANGYHFPLVDDGEIGIQTLSALRTAFRFRSMLLDNLVGHCVWFCNRVLAAHPADSPFREDWMSRAKKLPSIALEGEDV